MEKEITLEKENIIYNALDIGEITSGIEASASISGTPPNQKLNLILPQGDKGDTGEQGPQGNPGQDGKDGTNGIDGVSPNITIKSNTDEEYVLEITDVNGVITTPNLKGSKGLDGINGTNGVDGKKGENGLTPTIGENGNWFIGTTDTGVLARGVNGTDGEKGEQGEPGQNGIDGINGINGEDGATFVPSVDEDGNLSWTNNKGLENPPTINIKGQDGTNGTNGQDGVVDYTQVNAYIDEKIGNINNVLAMLVTVEESE